MSADDIPMVVRQAFHIATTGRPGPVLVDVPKDVLQNQMDVVLADRRRGRRLAARLPPHHQGPPADDQGGGPLILAAERPILYVGGGMLKARAAEALRELAELTGIHVVTTLMARGAFPDSHPLNLGMPGMHGTPPPSRRCRRATC
jgi:acetolactate synthase I/II/III large subunit